MFPTDGVSLGADLVVLIERLGIHGRSESGCDVRFGDYDEPDSLLGAFSGGERILLISASDIDSRTEQHRAAIHAAASVGVRHIVYTSGLNPEPPNPAVIVPSHHATERALVESGLSPDQAFAIGTISSLNFPAASAAAARNWLLTPY